MNNELENKIFSCILLHPKILDEFAFNEIYFQNKKMLSYFTKLYKMYKYLDIPLILRNSKDNNKAMLSISELLNQEVSWQNVYGYYKELKDLYRKQIVDEYTKKLLSQDIDFQIFTQKILETGNIDNDDKELLNPNDIVITESIEREYTNIEELDYLLKGIEYGKLSLWSGISNHGKTTLMIQFAKECLKQHKKIFYFSGEQTSSEFKNYLYVGLCTKEQLDFITDKHNSKIYDTVPKKEVIEYFDNIYANDLYIYNNEIPNNNIDNMIKVMNLAFHKGTRIFFIDNFMQLDNSEKLEEQTKIVEKFKRFARDKNVIINLVAHPRKTQFMKSRLTIFDIAGTQNIANKSANICSIMRTDVLTEIDKKEIGYVLFKNGYNIENCDGVVEVIKTKGNACKMVGLIYDKEFKTYREAQKLNQNDYQKIRLNYEKKGRSREEEN